MTTYSREDDLVVALQQATILMAACGRFKAIAEVNSDIDAAIRVTKVADEFVKWLRQPKHVIMTLVAIEEIDDPSVTYPPTEGAIVTDIDSSQRARYVLTVKDDRNIEFDATLGARSSNDAVVTVALEEAPVTASGKDELVATFAGLGTATVEVYDPANPTVVLAADVIVANPGAVASASLGTPVIEEVPVP